MLRSMMAAGLVLTLCACASEPRHEFRGRRGGSPPQGVLGAAGAEARFRRLFISPSGEPFRGENGLDAWFGRADVDHDGAITLTEFQADAQRFFRTLDANGDGVIDAFEVRAYEEQIVPEVAANDFDRQPGAGARSEDGRRGGGGMGGGGRGGGGRRGGGGGRRGGGGAPADRGSQVGRGAGREGAARYSLINEPEPVANADENLDSRITLEEWKHATARRFLALDKTKTGRLTLDALKGKVPPPPR